MTQPRLRPLLSSGAAILLVGGLAVSAPAVASSGVFTHPEPIQVHHGGILFAASEVAIAISDEGGSSSELTPLIPPQGEGAPETAPEGAVATWITADVTVDHAHLADVDLVLESPDGRTITLASDIGGDSTGTRTLFFEFGLGALPNASFDAAAITGDPTDYDTADDVDPDGNAPASFGPLVGTPVDDGSAWTLHAYDDTDDENTGMVLSWNLRIDYGLPAEPAASSLAVNGLTGGVDDVNLVLSGLEGPSLEGQTLDGVELLLESPDGRFAHVLSDSDLAYWTQEEGLELTLDDQAAADLPSSGPLSSAAYRPQNYYEGYDQSEPIAGRDTMDMESNLSVFNGGSANGTWKLWAFQEYYGSELTIGSWSLEIGTHDPPAPPVPVVPVVPTTPAPPPTAVAGDITAPTVATTAPKNRARGVRTGAALRVGFSEAMDPSSLSARTVKLATRAGDKVKATLAWKAKKAQLVVNPTQALVAHTTYRLTIRSGTRDLAGNRLAATKRVTFTTA